MIGFVELDEDFRQYVDDHYENELPDEDRALVLEPIMGTEVDFNEGQYIQDLFTENGIPTVWLEGRDRSEISTSEFKIHKIREEMDQHIEEPMDEAYQIFLSPGNEEGLVEYHTVSLMSFSNGPSAEQRAMRTNDFAVYSPPGEDEQGPFYNSKGILNYLREGKNKEELDRSSVVTLVGNAIMDRGEFYIKNDPEEITDSQWEKLQKRLES